MWLCRGVFVCVYRYMYRYPGPIVKSASKSSGAFEGSVVLLAKVTKIKMQYGETVCAPVSSHSLTPTQFHHYLKRRGASRAQER